MPPSTDAVNTSQPVQTFYPPPPRMPNDPSWDLITLGVEEPLPSQDVIDELYVCPAALSLASKV